MMPVIPGLRKLRQEDDSLGYITKCLLKQMKKEEGGSKVRSSSGCSLHNRRLTGMVSRRQTTERKLKAPLGEIGGGGCGGGGCGSGRARGRRSMGEI